MEHKIIKYRRWIIAFSVLLTIGFSAMLIRLEVDPNLKNYFPKNMTSMVNTDRIEEVFGNQDMVIIIFKCKDILNEATLQRMKKVERELKQHGGVRKTTSMFGSNRIYGEDGVMYVEPTVDRIPENSREREQLRQLIRENDLVYKVVVSDDFRSSAIVLMLDKEVDEEQLFAHIHHTLEEYPGEEEIYFGGLPYLRQAIDKDVKRDGMILIPIALILMLIFLYLVFREWRGVWLPFLVVVMSGLVAVSLIPMLGWKFYVITILVPIMLIAIANDYGIHMIARYQELNAKGNGEPMKELARKITRSLRKPIFFTGLTTIAGISALLAHSMIPARQMALVTGIGILLAIYFSLVLLPALLSMLPRSAPHRSLSERGFSDPSTPLGRYATFVVRQSRLILPVTLISALLIASGVTFLQVDSNEENFFPEKHAVKKASRIINKKFGGSENISLLFSGDMFDPQILERMEYYQQEMKKLDAVDLTMGFSGVVREISKALNDPGDPWYDRIPPDRNAVAQYMELYNMSGDPGELEQLVDFNYEHAHLIIRINNTNNKVVNGLLDKLHTLTEGDPAVKAIGGYGYVRAELANKVLVGTFSSLGIALVLIYLLVSLIFRSPRAGLLGIFPLSVSVLILFGLMGILGVKLDVATAMISSIIIGVGVDYTIHFLWRYREERQLNKTAEEAVYTTIHTTGRGIIFNALSVIVGFLVLMISSFTPIRYFGVMVVISIFTCLAGAMLLMPVLLLRFRFRFLEMTGDQTGQDRDSELQDDERKSFKPWRRIAMTMILGAFTLTGANSQDPKTIIRESHEVVKVKSFEAVSTLTITDSRGNQRIRNNSMASMSFPDGTEKRIIKFNAPAEVKGTGILIFDYPDQSDDMWIYLPALRRTRRIVSREKSKSFMGSEFSNADMTAPALEDFNYLLLGEESWDQTACYRIESVPKTDDLEDEYGYSRSVSLIDKNNYLAYRTEYFNGNGDLYKTITNRNFKLLDTENQKYMVTRMEAVNHSNRRSSEMVMEEVAAIPTRESYFTVAYLEKE
jgi:predicted RND superfamily exporter protein